MPKFKYPWGHMLHTMMIYTCLQKCFDRLKKSNYFSCIPERNIMSIHSWSLKLVEYKPLLGFVWVFTWPTGSFPQLQSERHEVTIHGGSVSEISSTDDNWDTREGLVNFGSRSAFHGLVFWTHSCWSGFSPEHIRGGDYARWYLLLLKLTSAFRDIRQESQDRHN